MTSDSEISNAADRSGIGDADSLASTAASEAEAEYFVNDIHAERRFYVEPDSEDDEGNFVTQYLVEWAGYSMDRCSWEPKEMFTSEETLDGWEEKKKQIAEGRVTPFNLKSWEKRMAMLEKKTKKRKEARRRKREQRARQKCLPRAESSRLANLDITDAREPEADIAPNRAPSRLSVDSNASALFIPAETLPPSENVVPRQSLQQRAPPRSVTSSAQTNRNESIGSTTLIAQTKTTPNKLPNSRLSQLAKKPTAKQKPSARQLSPPPAAKPTLSSFGTGPGAQRAYRDHKLNERAPDLSQMELRKPSEFAPRMNIGITTSIVGSSVTSPKSPEAQNQPASENSMSFTGPPKQHTGPINDEAANQPEKSVALAPSSVMAPSVPRSSNLGSTVLVSSSAVLSDPSAPSNPEEPVGHVNSTTFIISPATQLKPISQANLTRLADSVDTIVSTFSPPGEAPLTNPVGLSTSALTAPSAAPYPRPPSHANIDRPTSLSASTISGFTSLVLPGARAEATSIQPARLPGYSLTTQSPAIPTRPRAMANFERRTENRDSQDSRGTVRGWDSYKPDSTRQSNNTMVADTYRPSELSRRSSPTRRSSPNRRSPPYRRSPSRRPRSPPSRRSPPPGRLSRSSLRDMGDYYAPRSPSPTYSRIASRSSDSIGLNGNPIANAQSFAPTEPRAGASAPPSLSIAAQIARMPVRDSWAPGCIRISRYFCNKALGEILVHMFIGPGKRPLGAFRLCGIRSDVQSSLILAKNPRTGQVEVWFKHLCTVREYEKLCQSSVSTRSVDLSLIEC